MKKDRNIQKPFPKRTNQKQKNSQPRECDGDKNPSLVHAFSAVSEQVTAAISAINVSEIATKFIPTQQTLPVYLLPTGTGSRDFKCVFVLDEFMEHLNCGKLVKPKIQIHSPRELIDRVHLAEVLKTQFSCQLSSRYRAAIEGAQVPHGDFRECLTERKKLLGEKASESLGTTLSLGLLSLFLVAHPAFHLVVFSLAIFSGVDGMTRAAKYLEAIVRLAGNEAELEQAIHEINKDFDVQNSSFMSAVNKLEVKVNPLLVEVLNLFAELDLTEIQRVPSQFLGREELTHTLKLLGDHCYLDDLSPEYKILVEVVIQKYSHM